jgi:hypothetical protein
MHTPSDAPPSVHSSDPTASWTVSEAAADLVAQIAELTEAGARRPGLLAALQREGVTTATAEQLLDSLGVAAAQQAAADRWGIDLAPLHRALRRDADPQHAVAALAQALQAHGVATQTSRALGVELLEDERAVGSMARRRRRRLGLQAVVAGALFTSYFGWLTLQSGVPHAAWTALASAGLAAYGALMWWRYRD